MKTLQLVLGFSLLSLVSTSALASPAHKAGAKHKAAKVSKKSARHARASHASKSVGKRPKHASLVNPSDKALMQPKWL